MSISQTLNKILTSQSSALIATIIVGCRKQNQTDFRYQDAPNIIKVNTNKIRERELRYWQDHSNFLYLSHAYLLYYKLCSSHT